MIEAATGPAAPAPRRVQGDQEGWRVYLELPLPELQNLADDRRRALAGDRVTYTVNRHIEPTNICHESCSFCSFAKRSAEEKGAFRRGIEEILEATGVDEPRGISEYHIVGGVDPELGLDYYVDLVSQLREAHPGIEVKALSAVEIGALAKREGLSFSEVLSRLRDAGSAALTGGGAEIFAPRVRKRIAPKKITGEEWLEIHETAHGLGMYSNATMLFGHIETMEERMDHLAALRELQARTRGFRAFVPLPFRPWPGTALANLPAPAPEEFLRMIALGRLVLDNFPAIKAYWPAVGFDSALAALDCGANDLDGTVTEETIYETGGSALTEARLCELIRSKDRIPVRR